MADTVFHLRPVETKSGRVALVTIDNGEDWTKPPSLGRSAFESGQALLADLEGGDWVAALFTGKPFWFCAGADINAFPEISPETAGEGSRAGDTREGGSQESIREAVKETLESRFLPEFINRIDEVIIFEPLTEAELAKIVEIMLREVRARLSDRSVEFEITEAAKAAGSSPSGRRPRPARTSVTWPSSSSIR